MTRLLASLLLCALLLLPTQGWGACTLVQKKMFEDFVNGTSFNVVLNAATTAGNTLLVVSVARSTAGATNNTPTMTGETFTPIDVGTYQTTINLGTYYAKNIAGGQTTITATFGADVNGGVGVLVHELSGCDTTAPIDQHTTNSSNNSGTGTDVVTSGSVTTTSNGQYIFGVAVDKIASGLTAGSGFSAQLSPTGNNGLTYSEDMTQASAGSVAATWTPSSSTAYAAAIVTVKSAPSVAPTFYRRLVQ